MGNQRYPRGSGEPPHKSDLHYSNSQLTISREDIILCLHTSSSIIFHTPKPPTWSSGYYARITELKTLLPFALYHPLMWMLAGDHKQIIIDEATRYQVARWMKDISTKHTWDPLRMCWIDRYIGRREYITHDAGKNSSH